LPDAAIVSVTTDVHDGATTSVARWCQRHEKGSFMELKAGMQLRGVVGTTEIVVVRAPEGSVVVTSGGVPMVGRDEDVSGGDQEFDSEGSVLLGKRYVDDAATIEVLVTKPGDGVLALDGQTLEVKNAKPLPSSD
jgi:hypothetical protein